MSTDSGPHAWKQAIVSMSRICIVIAFVFVLSWGRPILVPIALATLFTFLLNPVVRRLQKFGIGRLLSVILAVSTMGIILAGLSVVGSRQISVLLSELPANTTKIKAKVRMLKALLSGPTTTAFEEMIDEITREFHQLTPKKSDAEIESDKTENATANPTVVQTVVPNSNPPWLMVTGYLGSAFEVMATFAFAMILLVFFLLEREGLRDRIVLLAGKARLTLTSKALEDATQRVSRYIVMVALVNGGFGLLLTLGLLCLGVPYAVLWGCVAGLLRFIPYIGPWVGAVFPIALSLAMSEGWWQPISVFAFVVALELVTNNAVEPILFGRTTGVAPAALLISAAFWLYLWGPIGLVLSAPFTVCLVVLGKNIPQLAFLNVLLGEQPALAADVGFYQRLLVRDQHEASALVVNRLTDSNSERVFDDLLIPALNYARRDVLKGHLTQAECDSLLAALADSFSEVKLHHNTTPLTDLNNPEKREANGEIKRLVLLGCSADGNIDRTALAMLKEVLDPRRWDLEIISEDMLTSEIANRVASDPPSAICIASLPPDGVAHARYLCKKIRATSKDIPIIVGRWARRSVRPFDRDRLLEAGANEVTGTLGDTRRWLLSRHSILEQDVPVSVEQPSVAQSQLVAAL